MKKLPRFARRALSFVLCLAMVMTTMFFFDIGITKPEAAVSVSPITKGRTAFYAPEVIYLYPSVYGWRDTTSAPFQFYVQNDVIPTDDGFFIGAKTNTNLTSKGQILFSVEGGYSDPQLAYRFVDENYGGISGGSVTTVDDNDAYAGDLKYRGYQITGGQSPNMDAATTGCYIEWTLTYTDNCGERKAVIAYTYVYKPYTVPYGGVVWCKNTKGTDNDARQLGWVSGVHSVAACTTTYDGAPYPRLGTNGTRSMGAFLTSVPTDSSLDQYNGGSITGYVGTTPLYGTHSQVTLSHSAVDTKRSDVKDMVGAFATTTSSNSYFYAMQSGSTWSNEDCWNWVSNDDSEGNRYNVRSFNHWYRENSNTNECSYMHVSSLGTLYVDTSRYSNLKDIPNLGVGLMVTADTSSSVGSWFVADATDKAYTTGTYTGSGNRQTFFNARNYTMAGAAGECDGNMKAGQGYEVEERKYTGSWYSPIDKSLAEKTYTVSCYYGNHRDGNHALTYSVIDMKAVQINKTDLRNAVYEAIAKLGQLGMTSGYGSYYYSTTSSYWNNFVAAYKEAYMGLTKLDGSVDPAALASALRTAINTLENTVGKKMGDAIQYNVGLMKNRDGSYRIIEIPNSVTHVDQFTYGDKLEFTADTYAGYTFKGALKLDGEINDDAIDNDTNLASLPSFTSSSNKADYSITVTSGVTTITNTGTVHPTTNRATVSGSTITYLSATDDGRVGDYDFNICYVYFYELTEAEVLFGNDFDFDHFYWTADKDCVSTVDRVNNTLTMETVSGTGDAYTSNYDNNQPGYMTLVPGRVYEYSCTVKNNTSSNTTGNMFLFTFPTAPANSGVSIGADRVDFTSASVYLGANETGEVKGTLTIPEGRPYATIRVGSYTPDTSVTFSNICVRDITVFTETVQTNDVTKPDPLYKSGARASSVTDFPTLTRPGYVFAGWSTVREANGNGAAANMVTSVAVPANGNETLYPVWQTNVIYDTNGGFYRKSSDPMQTSYQAEGRWNVAIGTSVAVSNRIAQGQTNWNSTDVNNTYVPYQPGHNFKGWLAESVDPAVNGKTYWPGNAVVTNANVEFTAQWEAAPSITTQKQQISSSANGGYSFYPGQIYFYGFTPADRGMYVSAYTFDPGRKTVDGATVYDDFELHLFNSELEELDANTDRVYTYGLDNDDDIIFPDNSPMVTRALDRGSEYFYGLTLQNHATSSQDAASFKITEHTINFTLNPAKTGATISGSATPITKVGYGNEDTVLPTDGELFGYDFAGWTTQGESPEKTYTMSTDSTCVIPGADNTAWLAGYVDSFVKQVYLNANWTADKFGVVYDGNPGSSSTKDKIEGIPNNGTFTYDSDGQVSDSTPTMPGYTFKGWALTSEQQSGETLYTTTAKTVATTTVNKLYTDMFNAGETTVTLYARWAPNLIIVDFYPGEGNGSMDPVDFYFDTPQQVDPINIEPAKYTINFYNPDETVPLVDPVTVDLEFEGWQDVETGTPNYTYANGATILNPNGKFGISDTKDENTERTSLYAMWKGGSATVTTPVVYKTEADHVLVGWSVNPDASTTDYSVGQTFVPSSDMDLYAVWYSTESANNKMNEFNEQYLNIEPVVSGIKFTNEDLSTYETIQDESVPVYDTAKYNAAVSKYKETKNALLSYPTVENNKAYYDAIKAIEALEDPATFDPIKTYLTHFEIEYPEGVTPKVKEQESYSLADMNLNHYDLDNLQDALDALNEATDVENMLGQKTINESVATMAAIFANPEDVKTEKAPLYNVFETAASINGNAEIKAEVGEDETPGVSYVYTKYDANTYYCYTNALKPTVFVSVDDIAGSNDRVCYPTTAKFGDTTMMAGSDSEHKIMTMQDETALAKYQTYLDEGLGTKLLDEDPNYYTNKAVVKLTPDFSTANDRATVRYELTAHDDSFAGLDGTDKNYASTSKLSTKEEIGVMKDETSTETPELTIIFCYHKGNVDVNGLDVPEDKWIKQYHLARTSGGANNWEYGKVGDTVYTLDDPTYGQTGFGSFTYTFKVEEGAENDFVNCVLNTSDLEEVKELVAANYGTISSVPFDGAQEIWKWATDPADGVWKYMKTHAAGTGLGYLVWPSGWSFNYYPASQAYTYVHIVDRWGNAVDKIIQVPNLDASPTQLHTNAAGVVDVIEVGGSGIETMSFSSNSFEIIPDENSIFDGETYTTAGNTIKVYTGEANKTYSLTANDVATNKTTENVTTDAEGYLTITVEDKEFDTQSGAYTFTLNGMEINLYAEVEKNIVSAEDVSVEEGQTATVEIITTDKVTSVQLVSEESGSTTTATTYEEDENGNRVWTLNKKKAAGEYEYKVRYKTGGGWLTEGDTVKVTVTKPIIFVGAVTEVSYTPSTSTRNEFMFTVTGRPDKIQVISEDGGTRTYDRYHVKVVIVSYDAEGNVVGAMSRDLSYEVWTIEMNVPAGEEFTAVARYGREWSKDAPYKYTVVLATPEFDDEVYEMKLAADEGEQGRVLATVVTGLDVSGVKFTMDNNTTATYYTSTEADGKLTYTGDVWINHRGDNVIIVKIRVNNAWLNAGELSYYAI